MSVGGYVMLFMCIIIIVGAAHFHACMSKIFMPCAMNMAICRLGS